MKVRRYFAANMRNALEQVRQEQGPDVIILSNRKVDGGVELLTAIGEPDAELLENSPHVGTASVRRRCCRTPSVSRRSPHRPPQSRCGPVKKPWSRCNANLALLNRCWNSNCRALPGMSSATVAPVKPACYGC